MVLLLYAACFLVTMFSARERRHRRPSVPEVRGDARVSLLLSQVETGIYLSIYLFIYLSIYLSIYLGGDRQRPGLRERRGQRAPSTGCRAQAPAQAHQQQNHSHAAALWPRQAGLLSTKAGSECKEINIKSLVIKINLLQTLCLPLDFYRTINQAPPILQTLFWTDLASWVCISNISRYK